MKLHAPLLTKEPPWFDCHNQPPTISEHWVFNLVSHLQEVKLVVINNLGIFVNE